MMILDAAAAACTAPPDHARREPRGAGSVFKVQANIDSQHRDWIAVLLQFVAASSAARRKTVGARQASLCRRSLAAGLALAHMSEPTVGLTTGAFAELANELPHRSLRRRTMAMLDSPNPPEFAYPLACEPFVFAGEGRAGAMNRC
jgi:hypothetical protein